MIGVLDQETPCQYSRYICKQRHPPLCSLRKDDATCVCTTTPSSRFIQMPEAIKIAIITIEPIALHSSRYHHCPLNTPTPAALLELLELPLRCLLASSGLVGCSPLARANKFNISVRLTTPESRPDMCSPGSADAETEGVMDKG